MFKENFSDLSDDQWLHVVLEGRLFGMPDEDTQTSTVGRSGDGVLRTAFEFYLFLKKMLSEHGPDLTPDLRVLDFGCGWGRIIRFFTKTVEAPNIIGVDVQAQLLAMAMRDVPGPSFRHISPQPSCDLPGQGFGLIYAYSVLSHLPEPMSLRWVEEFERLLQPGGLLCVTTRPRAHIVAAQSAEPPKTAHSSLYASIIGSASDALQRYDAGEFVHFPAGAGTLQESEWGESAIPLEYARSHLSKGLEFIGYFENYGREYLQPALVYRKPQI